MIRTPSQYNTNVRSEIIFKPDKKIKMKDDIMCRCKDIIILLITHVICECDEEKHFESTRKTKY